MDHPSEVIEPGQEKNDTLLSLLHKLDELAGHCQNKRAALAQIGSTRTQWRTALNVIAGTLALISGASITAVIADLTNSFIVKVFSAAVAF